MWAKKGQDLEHYGKEIIEDREGLLVGRNSKKGGYTSIERGERKASDGCYPGQGQGTEAQSINDIYRGRRWARNKGMIENGFY